MPDESSLTGADLVLQRLFGSWIFGGSGADSVTALSHLLSLLTAGGLIFYIIILHYIVIVGLIKSARSGSALSSGWHPAWTPFRVGFALMLLLPLTSGANWSAGQTGLIALTRMGSDMADWMVGEVVSDAFLDRFYVDDNFRVTINPETTGRFVNHTMLATACWKGHEELGNPNDLRWGSPEHEKWLKDVAKKCGIDYGFFDGSIAAHQYAGKGGDTFSALPWESDREKLLEDQNILIRKAVADLNRQWFVALANYYDLLYGDVMNLSFKEKFAYRLKITQAYHDAVEATVNNVILSNYTKFAEVYAEDLQKRGWFYVFSAQQDLASQTQLVQASVNATVERLTPKPKLLQTITENDQMINMMVSEVAEKEKAWWEELGDWISGVWSRGADAVADYTDEQLKKLGSAVADFLGIRPLMRAADGELDPIVAMTMAGKQMINVGVATWAVDEASDMVGAKGIKNPLVGFIDVLGDVAGIIGIPLLVAGAILFVLSFVPVLYGLTAFLRWMVYVVETLIAAPFWLAAHAAPEGDTHSSRLAWKGYNNVLFITLFPALAVAGFIAAMAISTVAIPIVLDIGWLGLFGVNPDSMEGIGGVLSSIASLALFIVAAVLFCWIVVTTAYQLIDTAPTSVLNWISTSEPGLNPFQNFSGRAGQVFGGATHRAKAAAVGMGIGRAARGVSGLGAKARRLRSRGMDPV